MNKLPKAIRPFQNIVTAGLAVVIAVLLSVGLSQKARADWGGLTNWIDSNGNTVPAQTVDWTTRLEFMSPTQIRDKVTGTIYLTGNKIFGHGSDNYLRDGDGTWNDSNYLFIPTDNADHNTPKLKNGDKCLGIISWHLHGDGSKSDLIVAQPEPSSNSGCHILKQDGQSGYAALDVNTTSDIAESVRWRITRLGSSDEMSSQQKQDWGGGTERVRYAVAGLYWMNSEQIAPFNSDVIFSKATGGALTGLKAQWSSPVLRGTVPSTEERQDANRFTIWATDKNDPQCPKIFLVTDSTNYGNVFIIDSSEIKEVTYSDNTVAGCMHNNEMDGDGGDLINSEKPTAIAYKENAVLTAEQVDKTILGGGSAAGGAPDSSTDDGKPQCEDGWQLAWIVCPVLNAMDSATKWVEENIQGFLYIDTGMFDKKADANGKGGIYNAWSVMRSLSTVVIVLIALIMIVSEAMGQGIFDNYSVKKLLPRLLLAGIGTQLSWFLMRTMVDIFNTLGDGIGNLLLNPFGIDRSTPLVQMLTDHSALDSSKGLLVGLVVGASIVLFISIISLGVMVVSALFIAFATLIVRNIIIYLGIVFAPVAIALSVLPGTQKASKWWWESFEKALMMYPLVMALFATGKIMAWLLLETGGTGQSVESLYLIAAIIAWYIPLFFFPKALQTGGALLGKVSGFANDKSKGFLDKAKGWKENRNKFKKAIRDEKRAIASSSGYKVPFSNKRLESTRYLAGARMRAASGMPIIATSKTAGGRRALQAMYAAQDQVSEKAEKEAKSALMREDDGQVYSSKSRLLDRAQDTSRSSAERSAARSRLVEMGAATELRYLRDGKDSTGAQKYAPEHASRQEFNSLQRSGSLQPLKAKAPDLPDSRPVGEIYKDITPGNTLEWDKQSWQDASSVNAVGVWQAAQDLRADLTSWNKLSPDARAVLEPLVGTPKPTPPVSSDIRLKRDISQVSVSNEIKLYKYRYLWSDTFYVGVMAQDLTETHPEALSIDSFGYYHVDYSKLGIKFMTYSDWVAEQAKSNESGHPIAHGTQDTL